MRGKDEESAGAQEGGTPRGDQVVGAARSGSRPWSDSLITREHLAGLTARVQGSGRGKLISVVRPPAKPRVGGEGEERMNNPVAQALRRHGKPAPVTLAYPSSRPGANASLASCSAPGGHSKGCHATSDCAAKPGWLHEWEAEWGNSDEWGAEVGHALKLAVLSPITTWGVLGQAIWGAGDDIDMSALAEEERYREMERQATAAHRAKHSRTANGAKTQEATALLAENEALRAQVTALLMSLILSLSPL